MCFIVFHDLFFDPLSLAFVVLLGDFNSPSVSLVFNESLQVVVFFSGPCPPLLATNAVDDNESLF